MLLKTIFFTGLFQLLVCNSYSQKIEGLPISISLRFEEGFIDSSVYILSNNETNVSYKVEPNKKLLEKKIAKWHFNDTLPFKCEFTLTFYKPGYISKRIAFNTYVEEERADQGFHPYDFVVVLFKASDTLSIDAFIQPIALIQFSRLTDDFNFFQNITAGRNQKFSNGVTNFKNGLYNESIKDFDSVLSINPDDNDALFNRGVAKYKLNNTEGACADWALIKNLGLITNVSLVRNICDKKN